MLGRIFPKQLDNVHRGHVAAIWLLVPIALMKLVQGANVAGLNPWVTSRHVLETADRVPVGAFPAEAASHLVFIFAAWGLSIFVLGLVGVIALVRYRAMIPLIYLLLLIEQAGRKALSMEHLHRPFVSFETSAANLVNWAYLVAIVLGLVLSLWRPRSS